ncbi:hypothetical protein A1D18_04725 [Candidatus Rickettsiella isopodorum]|jgi:hypothetical protein|uniref:Uncharacterized protein n=1 Tax=Candidatus Rickettsiella isopodorum TaxID=1225476 RepID=A0A1J8P9W5_9COXI|nr:hypothetical protein [Candidatus Rickettsiella isopodorum]MCH9636836.1 hypothetical protein [Gammaproteobacteria bacterium]OIZ94167.1 hypothetical protein A1D18_04725 [Candidatus Rickettsiella isopodorum]
MQEPTHLKKRISGNVNSENTTQEIAQETSAKASKKTTSNERSRFYIFQKLVCSNSPLVDDESEVMVIPKSRPK